MSFGSADLCKVLDFMQWYGINEEQLSNSLKITESFITCLDEPKDDTSLMKYAKAVIMELEDVLSAMRQGAKVKAEQERISYYKNRNLTADELSDLESIAKRTLQGFRKHKALL